MVMNNTKVAKPRKRHRSSLELDQRTPVKTLRSKTEKSLDLFWGGEVWVNLSNLVLKL